MGKFLPVPIFVLKSERPTDESNLYCQRLAKCVGDGGRLTACPCCWARWHRKDCRCTPWLCYRLLPPCISV